LISPFHYEKMPDAIRPGVFSMSVSLDKMIKRIIIKEITGKGLSV